MFKPILTICLCLSGALAFSQDANYWSSSYGPGSFLTPGASIANNGDSGVFFYNPALLGLSTRSSTTITGNVYRLEHINLKNGAGMQKDLKYNNISIIPLMVSGNIFRKGFTIGYALINNPMINFSATQREDSKKDVLHELHSPGPEYFVGHYAIQNVAAQTSGILSIGKKLSSHWSAGISMEAMLHRQTYNKNFSARALLNNDSSAFAPIAGTRENYLIKYSHVGLRFKAGLSYDAGDHHFGLVVTSPLTRLAGSGTLLSEVEINDIRDPDGFAYNLLASTRQENLKSSYRMPVSIAAGYAYNYGKGQLYIAAEYFAKVKAYNVIAPRNEYFIRPDTSNNSTTASLVKLSDARKALVNVALGCSYQVKPTMTAYLSLRTDFNYIDPSLFGEDFTYAPNTTNWNNYHAELGANFLRKKFNLRTGLLLGYGRTTSYRQDVNFDSSNESNFLQGDPGKIKATHLSLGLMFSYIHNL